MAVDSYTVSWVRLITSSKISICEVVEMIKIGDFSKLTKISIRMLRHYDEIGLLKPETVDRYSGYRYYSVKQLSDANRIRALSEMGFGLSETAEIIMQYNDTEAIADFLEKKQKELERERTG